jgi:2-amino-4-hydroxy-6-hydroxymethyldihydropteridine diphosphokinase
MAALSALPRTRLVARSSIYRTVPIDAAGPDYLNAVAQIDTGLSALELLAHLQTIERQHGRERLYRNAPRTLDLDLLTYGCDVIGTPELTVPHPRMHRRAFVLVPLAEVAPELEIPGLGPVAHLLPGVADQAIVRIAEPPSSRRNAARATSAAPAINPVETHKPRRAP